MPNLERHKRFAPPLIQVTGASKLRLHGNKLFESHLLIPPLINSPTDQNGLLFKRQLLNPPFPM